MHISIKFCLDFFITSRSIHVVLIGFQYIFFLFLHFSIFRFVALRFEFQYISLRNISFRFVSFRSLRFDFVSQFSTTLYKKGSKQIWVSMSLFTIFVLWKLYTCEQEQMRNIIIKKKCLLFKHEKNNQTLSNE